MSATSSIKEMEHSQASPCCTSRKAKKGKKEAKKCTKMETKNYYTRRAAKALKEAPQLSKKNKNKSPNTSVPEDELSGKCSKVSSTGSTASTTAEINQNWIRPSKSAIPTIPLGSAGSTTAEINQNWIRPSTSAIPTIPLIDLTSDEEAETPHRALRIPAELVGQPFTTSKIVRVIKHDKVCYLKKTEDDRIRYGETHNIKDQLFRFTTLHIPNAKKQ